jgi:hypothetical protein
VAALTPLILASAAWALDEAKDKPRPDPPEKSISAAEQFRDLQQQVQKARSEILEKYRKAEKAEEKQELLQEYNGLGRKFAGRYLEFARKHAGDPAALQALTALVAEADGAPEAATAADLIVKDHASDRHVAALVQRLATSPSAAAETIIRGVMEKAEDKDGRAAATFALAQNLKERAGTVRQLQGATPDAVKRLTSRVGEDGVRQLRAADPAKLEADAEKLFDTVMKEYADVKQPRGTLGERAKAELFELRHLAIGRTAPEIEAEDIAGQKFKLSDYRGKAVLLDFWGHW